MKFPSFMTIKDFLNYYVSGFIWLINISLIFLPLSDFAKLIEKMEHIRKISNMFNDILIGLIFLIIPYLLGFVLTPISMLCTKFIRWVFGDPKKWITDYEEISRWKLFLHKGKRLSKTNIRLIIQKLKTIYGNEKEISETKIAKWFFQTQAIVINQEGEVGGLAIRAKDLANFAESILLPIPILFFILFVKFLQSIPVISWVCFGVGICVFGLLSYRYLHLRIYWVKHVYRAFLVGQIEKN